MRHYATSQWRKRARRKVKEHRESEIAMRQFRREFRYLFGGIIAHPSIRRIVRNWYRIGE